MDGARQSLWLASKPWDVTIIHFKLQLAESYFGLQLDQTGLGMHGAEATCRVGSYPRWSCRVTSLESMGQSFSPGILPSFAPLIVLSSATPTSLTWWLTRGPWSEDQLGLRTTGVLCSQLLQQMLEFATLLSASSERGGAANAALR